MRKLLYSTIFALLSLCMCACDTSEQDFEKASEIGTAKSYDSFITNHQKSNLVEDARDSIVAVYERNDDLNSIIDELNEIVDYEAAYRVRANVERRTELLYEQALSENSVDGWNVFIKSVPVDFQKDARERLMNLQWQNESFAWQMATENDNAQYYEKYLENHPKGKHAKQAEKKLIDIEVASVFSGEHGILPQMDRGYSTGASYSVIEIENRTQYELTVSYSGPDSKRMVIPSYGTKSMRIGNGSYRVAASVGHGVIPYAGTEYLDGSHFSSSFYISTTRSYN